ncbi:diguanylate cyclase [Edwardsiella piscicida]|uniref:diguanylate cyclase n=3 Tax=Edwardsiella TaxID=635 RepID=A0A0H3DT66_EDWTF|nr:diguanylate cyclase [Edwardsiella piscicida]ACY84750.1 response regulator receiver modulated diguanylate cyclase [Edwardsiella tarda EIB202]ADM41832.1 Response regulator [Edwardsiella tarda FL6-60]ARD19780.1 diguanylate cyclase response regulator [Edwardsiella piscicida]EKS7793613.1 diguanylate cyclase [Edwardsiella piscicida]EKS7813266.1 diguanylate cyclase [Edwardsiella piscicida]
MLDQLTPYSAFNLPGRERPRLLIVDDEPINIQILYQLFADDHTVFMATNGQQALNICMNQHPDLVLLDIEMPEMNGLEVCQRLKASPQTQDIPVIFITAHIDEAMETTGLRAGAVDFISKPINHNIVRARVNTHLLLKMQSDLLRQLAYLDGLCGVYNRRYFDVRFAHEWQNVQQHQIPLSLILFDVDLFKDYNDLYGHLRGDDALRQVAATLRGTLNHPGDLVARYGGEEFICLLPATPLADALACAERMRRSILALSIEHARSPVSSYLTVSAGVCSVTLTGDARGVDFLQQTDSLLYQAKSQGRNRCCAAQFNPEA